MNKKQIENLAAEFADKHFLEDVEILMNRPWPEAKEHYKQVLINFATSTLSHQWIPVEGRCAFESALAVRHTE